MCTCMHMKQTNKQVVTTSHSFNPALVHAIGGAISTEARVLSNHGGHAGGWVVKLSCNGSTSIS